MTVFNSYLDKTKSLTPDTAAIICYKATEPPFSGNYGENLTQGTYLCRRCGLALFRAHQQFSSSCGWPSYDDALTENIKECQDEDGLRIEISCTRCNAHLGHVFRGEYLTDKNLRYCVNSRAIDFVEDNTVLDTEEAIIAGGCFWGIDYYMRRIPGVLNVEVGYTGGHQMNPDYEAVCHSDTGHYEAARVIFDKSRTNYYTILKTFFNIHDPTQKNGQGPDIGQQYQSAIFYYNHDQETVIHSVLQQLKENGYSPATRALPVSVFWPAEQKHQNYYGQHQHLPYCHRWTERI